MTPLVRIAVIGAGWWATEAHLPSLATFDQADLVAVCDPDLRRAESAASAFGAGRAAVDPADLFASDDIEAVIIATPHTTHFELAAAALKRGIHVLVEKPLTTKADEAWELVRLARENDALLSIGATYQYATTFRAVERAVREDIGELVLVNGEFSSQTEGLFATTDESSNHLDPGLPHGVSYSDPALSGGGQGQTQLTHILGAILKATGLQSTTVTALMHNHGLRVDLVDALAFSLEGGVLATTSSTGSTPIGVPVRHVVRYHGRQGMVEHDLLSANAMVYRPHREVRRIGLPDGQPRYEKGAVARAFVSLVQGLGPNLAPGDVGAATVSLIDAAYRSAQSGAVERVVVGQVTS